MNYYDKINWKNRSEGKTTKISAERLNHMDNQIFNNANAIGNVEKIADIGDGTLCGAAETLKETAEKLTQSLANIMPSGDMNILFNFSNRATDGGLYLTNSVYMPKNLTFTLSSANFLGSSGNFASQVTVNRNGNYINLTAENPAFAGLMVSCVGTIS